MADYINNVAAGDGYTAACTLGPMFEGRNVVITVANNAALMQFAVGKLGNWRWTDEREFFSIPQSFRVANVIGVRFRNANAGQIARILAVLAGDDDPDIQSGTPFTATLSPSGGVSAGVITGSIKGTTGAIVAGTGFTCVRLATGTYQITFTTAFSAAPCLTFACLTQVNNTIFVATGTLGPAGFTVGIDRSDTGAAQDADFNFTAQAFA